MRTIRLRYAATCADCGAALPVGAQAKLYGRGKVYGTTCHAKPARASGGGKMVWVGGERVRGSRCEDAPCCGCCGPGSDDPAYHEPDPYDRYDD